MKKATAILLLMAGASLVAVACQSGRDSSPAAPSNAGAAAEGGAAATVFATPQPSPVGPGPAPSPIGPGPAPSPVGPYPGFPATPTPTPTPAPTATPGPTSTPCPVGVHEYNVTTPFPTNGGGNGPSIAITDLPGCFVTAVETSFRVTSADLAISTSSGDFAIGLFIEGVLISDFVVNEGPTLTGTEMGTTCSDLVFSAAGTNDFFGAAPAAPYTGTFLPYGNSSSHDKSFARHIGKGANGTWSLPFYRLDAPVSVACWTLRLTVSATAPGP